MPFQIDFDVLEWAGPGLAKRVRIHGHDANGNPVEEIRDCGPSGVDVAVFHEKVAKLNNNEYRFDDD